MSKVLKCFVVFYAFFMSCMLATTILGMDNTSNTINISSDKIVVSYMEDQARFIGHVIVVHPQLKIQADEITVLYAVRTSDATFSINQDFIRRILLHGGVKLQSGLQTIQSESGEYDLNLGQVILYKNVRLQNAQTTVWGNKVTYDVYNKSAVISTDEGQVVQAEFK